MICLLSIRPARLDEMPGRPGAAGEMDVEVAAEDVSALLARAVRCAVAELCECIGAHGLFAFEFLREVEGRIANRSGLTADELFRKYWVNYRETVEQEFERDNKGAADHPLYQHENDCLKYGLNDQVTFTGAIPSIQVRRIMEQASIYICSSDRQEGWGAVVNEAMNSGCAVIADQMIGSAPFLIDSGYNGYTYRSFNELSDVIAKLLNDENECRRIGTNAYMTISEEWNAKEAAKRLIQLIENLLNGHETPFSTGPCSIAEVINGE